MDSSVSYSSPSLKKNEQLKKVQHQKYTQAAEEHQKSFPTLLVLHVINNSSKKQIVS